MRRVLLGIFSIALILAGIGLIIRYGFHDSRMSPVASVCMRAGSVLGAIWLAFPQMLDLGKRYPPWLIGLSICAFCIFVVRPKLLLLLSPLFIALGIVQFISWMFKPPAKRTRQKSKSEEPRRDELNRGE